MLLRFYGNLIKDHPFHLTILFNKTFYQTKKFVSNFHCVNVCFAKLTILAQSGKYAFCKIIELPIHHQRPEPGRLQMKKHLNITR